MNWAFAREVGLPKFLRRRATVALHRALARAPICFRLPTGGKLVCPLWSLSAQDAFVTDADMDWGSEALFFSHLAKDGDFLDVGANIGYYSLYGAPVVRRVFSFEPDPRNHPALEVNAAQVANVLMQKVALSSQGGTVILDLGDESSVSKVTEETQLVDGKTITVEATTLDAFARLQGDLRVTGIKLDTEGHELPILQSGVETIRRDQPLILTELMRWPGEGNEAFRKLAEFATSISYQPFAFVPVTRGFFRAGQFRLVDLTFTGVFSSNPTKMIFLVPERLTAAFIRATH